jgi:prophage DNA circulation protein
MSFLTDRLYPASFKGAEFFFKNESRTDGRRTIVHSIYNREDIVEDAGKDTRVFNITGVVQGTFFKEDAKDLETQLNSIGSGILMHPELGALTCFCIGFTRNFSLNNLGIIEYSLVFKEDLKSTYPVPTSDVATQISSFYDKIYNFAAQDLKLRYILTAIKTVDRIAQKVRELADQLGAVSSAIIGGVTQTIGEVTAIGGGIVNSVTSVVNGVEDAGSAFKSQNTRFYNDAFTIVASADTISTELPSLINAVDSISTDGQERFDLSSSVFSFGFNDIFLNFSTEELDQRKQVLTLLNGTINVLLLVNMFDAATLIDYTNDQQIDAIELQLNSKYDDFINNESVFISDDMISYIDEMRILMKSFFDQERLNVSKVVEIETKEQPLAVLAYHYYGNTDNWNDLITLNHIFKPDRVSGTLKVLQE